MANESREQERESALRLHARLRLMTLREFRTDPYNSTGQMKMLGELLAERDALAAQVAALRGALVDVTWRLSVPALEDLAKAEMERGQ